MKKCVGISLVLVMAMLLASCKTAPSESTTQESSSETTTEVSETTAESETSESTEATTESQDASGIPDVNTINEDFVKDIVEFIPNEMGYSLRVAQAAYSAYSFAAANDLDKADTKAVEANLKEAISKLSDEDKARFAYNFDQVVSMIDRCYKDEEFARGSFGDVGFAEQMEELLFDEDAKKAWTTFSGTVKSLTADINTDVFNEGA